MHCLADPYPVFASLLTAQLSSLILWPPKTCRVIFNVVYHPFDVATLNVLDAFWPSRDESEMPDNVTLCRWPMSKPELFRRGYMRNIICKQTAADLVWLADCDYLWGNGCLDALAAMTPDIDRLVWPHRYMIHKDHATGDAEIARITPGEVFTPDLTLFRRTSSGFAIGGMQILPRDVARLGYLDGTKWSKPAEGATRFSYQEDRRYRGGPRKAIELPGVYRFRHSVTDYQPAAERLAATSSESE